ncbi:V-type proton ATPase subunit E 1-like [Physella acuta]|uniref:V-type proton ATPase subunit E 1-like n=1 Tax=Physella acuta TaxID=109671 RepID=UPI0027DB6FAC|nr:V-type proton ATPase subunit E 1-like [Physella acuta]
MAGMSDAEVQGQIAHMIAFIDQEASEKVEEIDAKAEEEFNLEKGRLVQTARAKIMDFYDKKIKQVELQKKIQQSNLLNNSRLQILKRKEELLNDLLDDARKLATKTVNEDPQKYQETMIKLTLQGLSALLEPKVTVQVRPQDVDLMKKIIPEVITRYRKLTQDKHDVKIIVDDQNFLAPEIIGGVIVSAHGDKIRINNTMNERLKLISRQMQPELRETLFGPNPNRKFKD